MDITARGDAGISRDPSEMSAATKGKIQALLQGNRFAEARKLCESLCKKHKSDAEAWFLLGSIHGQLGETEKAIDCLQHSISVQGNIPVTHYNLGLIYLHNGELSKARPCFEKALALDPGLVAARHELANTIFSQGNRLYTAGSFNEAAQQFRAALKLSPGSVEVLVNLGNALLELGQFDDAITSYREALEVQSDSADIQFNLGNAFRAAGRLDEAESTYRQALTLQPGMGGALNNLGLVLFEKGRYQDAEASYLQSMEANPQQTDSYINLAKCYRDQRRPGQALEVLEKALALFPDEPGIHWDLSLLLLETGEFSRGWDAYAWRWQGQGLPVRDFPFSGWTGEAVSDKTMLVYAEQGLGDEIMFASCFQALIKAAGQTVIECEPRLAPIFRRSFPEAIIHAGKQSADLSWLAEVPAPDLAVAAGSLPRYFRRQLEDFPAHAGYLLADPVETGRWRQRYACFGKKLVVGISWKGGHVSQAARRSSSIRDWKDILCLPDACFVNIQYGDVSADLERVNQPGGTLVHHWEETDPLSDMDNFAAQIAALDLVISVDNSTVHLAGALGVDTWVLQSYVPDWRWMNHATDSYWYPAVRQFHQSVPGEWGSVFQEVQEQLAQLIDTVAWGSTPGVL